MDQPARRLVYVLTLWEERPATSDRPAVWRFSLESSQAHQRQGFGSLSDVMAFLTREMAGREEGFRQGME